jgi:hypothetical protein
MGQHEKVVPGLISGCDLQRIREAVCIMVDKIYDSCREKDCIENARVIFKCPERVQHIIDTATTVRCRGAEIIDVLTHIEEVPFKRGFFTVDVTFFIKVRLEFILPTGPVRETGIVVFNKKVILFGSEGNVKIFKSQFVEHCGCRSEEPAHLRLEQSNLPIAKVEVAEPICLNARIQDILDKFFEDCCDNLPRNVVEALEADNEGAGERFIEAPVAGVLPAPRKRVVVTIGLFSIIKLTRLVQLLIPAFDFCFPNKECIAATEENPCELFDTIEFPFNEFFPPQKFDFPGATEAEKRMTEELSEGC